MSVLAKCRSTCQGWIESLAADALVWHVCVRVCVRDLVVCVHTPCKYPIFRLFRQERIRDVVSSPRILHVVPVGMGLTMDKMRRDGALWIWSEMLQTQQQSSLKNKTHTHTHTHTLCTQTAHSVICHSRPAPAPSPHPTPPFPHPSCPVPLCPTHPTPPLPPCPTLPRPTPPIPALTHPTLPRPTPPIPALTHPHVADPAMQCSRLPKTDQSAKPPCCHAMASARPSGVQRSCVTAPHT